jgi:hypothetical protein
MGGMIMELFSTLPDTAGKAAVVERSHLLTECEWMPIRDIPTFKSGERTVLPAGKIVRGVPYSSTEISDKFITENISFETFLTMIANPDGLIYTRDYGGGYDGKIWTYCGIVCNGLCRFAYDIDRRVSTKRWLEIPGMRLVAKHGEYTAKDIKLCDTLYAFGEGRNHVALITDILRDEDGMIRFIEVSEAIRTQCARHRFTPDEYFEKYKLFHLTRYDFVDSVPAPDPEWRRILFESDIGKIPPRIALDLGNKSNYRATDDVTISVFTEGEDTVTLRRDGKVIEQALTDGYTKIVRKLPRGYYTATLESDGTVLEFCITDPKSEYTVDGETITVRYDECDEGELLYMDFRETKHTKAISSALAKVIEVTESEKKEGCITRSVPKDAYSYKLYFKNKYGVWTHPMIIFR